MSVTVRVPTILRPFVDGASSVEVEPNPATLRGVLEALEAAGPGITQRVISDAGELRRFVNVYVNDDDVRFLDGLDTQIADGATVSVVPAVAGGC
jgi:molybdopterin converting factor small subunit